MIASQEVSGYLWFGLLALKKEEIVLQLSVLTEEYATFSRLDLHSNYH